MLTRKFTGKKSVHTQLTLYWKESEKKNMYLDSRPQIVSLTKQNFNKYLEK